MEAFDENPLADERAPGGVSEIPLFPLNLVLFPHMLVPLHIFEERYKEMINRCVRENLPFGIVLIEKGSDVGPGADTFRVGCTARIRRVERLPDGQMNIEVIGEQRFRILETHEVQSYRSAITEVLEDRLAYEDGLTSLSNDVHRLLDDYLIRQLALIGKHDVEIELPTDPQLLSFTAACVLPLENPEKQELLEETNVALRLISVRERLEEQLERVAEAEARAAEERAKVVFEELKPNAFATYQCEN